MTFKIQERNRSCQQNLPESRKKLILERKIAETIELLTPSSQIRRVLRIFAFSDSFCYKRNRFSEDNKNDNLRKSATRKIDSAPLRGK